MVFPNPIQGSTAEGTFPVSRLLVGLGFLTMFFFFPVSFMDLTGIENQPESEHSFIITECKPGRRKKQRSHLGTGLGHLFNCVH